MNCPASTTNISLVAPADLTARQIAAWSRIQSANPAVDSAFFHPAFTQAVAAVRNDVEVAVLYRDDEPAGFFPFERDRRNVARPVGLRLSEFHGVVAPGSLSFSVDELLAACRLTAWHFDHLPAAQLPFAGHWWNQAASPYMDLSYGFDPSRPRHVGNGSGLLSQILRKQRKLGREVGPLRFVWNTAAPEVFDALLAWKTEQYQRTKMLEIFRFNWVVELLDRVRQTQVDGFAGVLSALYAGDRLAAVHLGLLGETALHIWFPTFDRRWAKYSPGLVLLLEMAKAAAARGIERIDFGKGAERYKASLKSGSIPLAEGSVDRRPVARLLRRSWHRTKRWVRSSRYAAPLSAPLDLTRRVRQWWAFRQ